VVAARMLAVAVTVPVLVISAVSTVSPVSAITAMSPVSAIPAIPPISAVSTMSSISAICTAVPVGIDPPGRLIGSGQAFGAHIAFPADLRRSLSLPTPVPSRALVAVSAPVRAVAFHPALLIEAWLCCRKGHQTACAQRENKQRASKFDMSLHDGLHSWQELTVRV
jgi:hypothetical protein